MKKLLFLLTLSVCSGAALAEDCEINLIDRNINRVVLRFQSRDPWRGCYAIAQQCIDTGHYNRMNFECIRVPFVEPGRMPSYPGYSHYPSTTTTTTTTTTTYEYEEYEEYEDAPRRRPSRPSTSRPSTSRPSTTRPTTTPSRPTSTRPTSTTPAPTPSRPSNTGIPGSGSANGRIPGPRIEVNNMLMSNDSVTYSRPTPRLEYDLTSALEDTSESRRTVSVGETVMYKGKIMIVSSITNGVLELREEEGRGKETSKAKREEVSLTRGCSGAICVFDSVIDLVNKKYVAVAAISYNSFFITKSTEDQKTLSYEVARSSLAIASGCVQARRGQVCVGNKGLASNNVYYQVVGIQDAKRIVVETLDSAKYMYQDVDPNSLVITQ